MKEIYVKLDKKDGYYLAVLIHYYPFHSKRGLGKTREELLIYGVFVSALPERPQQEEGYFVELRADSETRELYYDVVIQA